MARIPEAQREQFPDDLKYVYDRLRTDTTAGAGEGLANIFLALGNNPQLLRAYLRLANPLWAHCGLDARVRELAILRCALLKNSAYEWHQHVRIGQQAGVTAAEIAALHQWSASTLFQPAERALLGWVDALAVSDHPGDAAFAEFARHYPPGAVVGITLLVGFYFMTATFLGAMQVATEEPFVGWLA